MSLRWLRLREIPGRGQTKARASIAGWRGPLGRACRCVAGAMVLAAMEAASVVIWVGQLVGRSVGHFASGARRRAVSGPRPPATREHVSGQLDAHGQRGLLRRWICSPVIQNVARGQSAAGGSAADAVGAGAVPNAVQRQITGAGAGGRGSAGAGRRQCRPAGRPNTACQAARPSRVLHWPSTERTRISPVHASTACPSCPPALVSS